jgi:hypothetical protein
MVRLTSVSAHIRSGKIRNSRDQIVARLGSYLSAQIAGRATIRRCNIFLLGDLTRRKICATGASFAASDHLLATETAT